MKKKLEAWSWNVGYEFWFVWEEFIMNAFYTLQFYHSLLCIYFYTYDSQMFHTCTIAIHSIAFKLTCRWCSKPLCDEYTCMYKSNSRYINNPWIWDPRCLICQILNFKHAIGRFENKLKISFHVDQSRALSSNSDPPDALDRFWLQTQCVS